jgi:23S rRNA-/tRNA-specific pseudouridylate synthase
MRMPISSQSKAALELLKNVQVQQKLKSLQKEKIQNINSKNQTFRNNKIKNSKNKHFKTNTTFEKIIQKFQKQNPVNDKLKTTHPYPKLHNKKTIDLFMTHKSLFVLTKPNLIAESHKNFKMIQ